MINKPLPFKDLNIGIPIITPIKERGFINHGSGLEYLKVSSRLELLMAFKQLGICEDSFLSVGPSEISGPQSR